MAASLCFLLLLASAYANRITPIIEQDNGGESGSPQLLCGVYYNDPGSCKPEMMNERGICNRTVRCTGGESHCYMSWRNQSGRLSVLSSGCWFHPEETCGRTKSECRSASARMGVHFCCCSGILCNGDFYADVASEDGVNGADAESSSVVVIHVLLPVLWVFIPAVLWYSIYKRT